jgi:hypothetical protein
MPRIVPSQVVAAIEATFEWAKVTADGGLAWDGGLGPEFAPQVATILALTEALPDELLPLDANDLLLVEAAKGAMSGALVSWTGAPHQGAAAQLRSSTLFGRKHPIVALLLALRKCPDERAGREVPGLAHIVSIEARESLRTDVSAAFRAYANGEYKAATVLAGAALEALLLWRLKSVPVDDITAAIEVVRQQQPPNRNRASGDLERWDLGDLIAVAAATGKLSQDNQKACDLCREFRNLIHPGRVLRKGADASKATALQALAALQAILEREVAE